jgi:uncharacterized membrane protein HdeD (DUF308 family)
VLLFSLSGLRAFLELRDHVNGEEPSAGFRGVNPTSRLKGEQTMNSQTPSDPFNPKMEECLRLQKCWPWFLGLGVLLVVGGMFAAGWAALTTLATVIVFGYLLLVGGVVQIVNTFLVRSWRGAAMDLLGGFLHLVIGCLMIEHPERAAEVLTLMLAVAFMIGGGVRIVFALLHRFAGWFWVFLNGAVTFALGILIGKQLPESAYWVIGLFVGIDLIFNGWSWIMLGLIVRGSKPRLQPVEAKAPSGVPVGMS